jgi:glycine cleavage system H protein
MNNPNNLKYTTTHEWARLEADGTVVVGITDHAQEALGDMVFVELPSVGRALKANEECAVVESVKAASDIYAPIAGSVTEVNNELNDAPEKINQDPYGAWIFKLKPVNAADMNGLLDANAYEVQVDSEG